MRTTERLRKLKKFVYDNLCADRLMKAPAPNRDISQIVRQKPACYLAWAPSKFDRTGNITEETVSVVPGIVIMPNQAHAKYMEEHRFDRYNNVHRPSEMGQHLAVSILFAVYEPGIRMPGFVDSMDENGKGMDITLIKEGTEEGLFTLLDWMDDCIKLFLQEKVIPETDMYLEETTMTYSLYTDQAYVTDRRPIYYGFINCSFGCHAEEGVNKSITEHLL